MSAKITYFLHGFIRETDEAYSVREQKNYKGFVHFWGAYNRVDAMEKYIESIIKNEDFLFID